MTGDEPKLLNVSEAEHVSRPKTQFSAIDWKITAAHWQNVPSTQVREVVRSVDRK